MTSSIPDGELQIILQLKIVPPMLRKQLSDGSGREPLRDVWLAANKALSDAETIVIIGYSLPATDFHAEWLLRTSLQKNPREKVNLTVINPDSNVAKRLEVMFGKKLGELKRYLSFEQFLQ
jgi:hypothetical protein